MSFLETTIREGLWEKEKLEISTIDYVSVFLVFLL